MPCGPLQVFEHGHHPFGFAGVAGIGHGQHGALAGGGRHQHAPGAEGQHARRLFRIREDADVEPGRQVELAGIHLGGSESGGEQEEQQAVCA